MPDTGAKSGGHALAIDVGGTFVDLTLCDLATGHRWVQKVLSDRGPLRALVDGLTRACAAAGITPGDLTRVVHGTTLATNAILEGRNDRTALVVSRGMRDLLEIGRHDAPRSSSAWTGWLKPRRPVNRDRVIELDERTSWDGTSLVPVSEAGLRDMTDRLGALKPASVAVCLLHAASHHGNERAVRDAIARKLPGLHVSLSCEVLSQAGEYERLMATVLNAYTMPAVSDYLASLEGELRDLGVSAPLYIMSSDGGVLSAADARRFPIHTALSGPAGGASGAAKLAVELGEPRIVTLDVGGTSSDVAATDDGNVTVTVSGEIGAFPLAVPVLDVHTVGAGGGSLAQFSDGRFSVGPSSAGSRPGPVCYQRGGATPTVTDALLVLGWLPEQLAGGALGLSVQAARAAIEQAVAAHLGMDAVSAAAGIVRLANANMASAIRHMSTERGRDPRDYALVSFGGAGGLHAVDVAGQVGIPRVIVPPSAGVFSTEGLLAADLTRSFVRSLPAPQQIEAAHGPELAGIFDQLERSATAWLKAGAATLSRRLDRYLDLRYHNQGFELIVSLPAAADLDRSLAAAAESFHAAHEQQYRYRLPDVPIEIVRARLSVTGTLPHAPRAGLAAGDAYRTGPTRPLYFDRLGWQDSAVVARRSLGSGATVNGPAVIEEYDSTTVMPPGSKATVKNDGTIVIEVTPEMGWEEAGTHG
jgi:N-methylhydantoinase A